MPILSIQSHVAYGHVGNSAAVFPLQRLGFEVWPVHTVQFAAHTGYGPPKGRVFDAAMISDVVAGISERPDFATCEAVLSGYMGSIEIGGAILEAVERVKIANPKALYCCDPVLGDVGKGFFVRSDVPEFMRDHVVPRADIITPNLFELEALTGIVCHDLASMRRAIEAMHRAGPGIVLVTSALMPDTPPDAFDMLVSDGASLWRLRTPKLDIRPNGAGDVTAALFLAHCLRTGAPSEAMRLAAASVHDLLEATAASGKQELQLVEAQGVFVAPSLRFSVERL